MIICTSLIGAGVAVILTALIVFAIVKQTEGSRGNGGGSSSSTSREDKDSEKSDELHNEQE